MLLPDPNLLLDLLGALHWVPLENRRVYFEKIRVLKSGECLYNCAWNNEIWPQLCFVGSMSLR